MFPELTGFERELRFWVESSVPDPEDNTLVIVTLGVRMGTHELFVTINVYKGAMDYVKEDRLRFKFSKAEDGNQVFDSVELFRDGRWITLSAPI
jgi:hypothetical protein